MRHGVAFALSHLLAWKHGAQADTAFGVHGLGAAYGGYFLSGEIVRACALPRELPGDTQVHLDIARKKILPYPFPLHYRHRVAAEVARMVPRS